MHSRSLFVLCLTLFATLTLGLHESAAQVNTSAIRGTVVADDGQPMIMAQVTLTHEPSGNTQTAYTNDSGAYSFTGLRVGGPYTLLVEMEGYKPNGAGNIHLTAGKSSSFPITLELAGEEVIEISGTSASRSTSARSVFDAKAIDELPTGGRDPKDLVKINPEAYVEGRNSSLSVGGANTRFNSITVDGIRQDDDFGLNSSGYPTQRSPIALSAIEEISVETSPFDVRYGKFLGGNVNVVTKSGTNEVKGSLVTTFANQDLAGKRTRNDRVDIDFREVRYGATLGFPIIKDKLHMFASIEALDATQPVAVGAAGSGAANEKANVTVEDVERVQDIARRVYGIDPGTPGQPIDEYDFKVFGKLDWAISPKHRLSTSYQRTDSSNIRPQLLASFDRLSLTSNWYDQQEAFDAFSTRLFSNWNSSLSTEFEFSTKLTRSRPTPLLGNEFMQAEITTPQGGRIVLGPDQFRHKNELDNDLFHYKGQADYLLGKHLFTAGWEYDHLKVFNWFVPRSHGLARYSSIDDFERMSPSSLSYRNSTTGDINDAAVNWKYGVHGAYLQDQFDITDALTVTGGVRAETYQSGSAVVENPFFEQRYGFKNTATMNGRYIFMPRLGVSYRAAPGLNVRTGVGLYSGGTPNVWISNNYTNDGITVDDFASSKAQKDQIQNFNGRDIPNAVAGELRAGEGNVDVLDPNFKLPRTWKASAGFDYNFLDTYELKFNYTFGVSQHSVVWKDLRRDLESLPNNTPVGTLPDGRPFYDIDDGDGMTFNSLRGYDMLLTNARNKTPHSHTISTSLSKSFGFGLTLFGAYAYQDVKDLTPATSSISTSNYGLAAVTNPQADELGISLYERKHRLLGVAQFSRDLIPKLPTSMAVFVERRSGQPYSYTFGGEPGDLARLFGEEEIFARENRMLFYVPKGDGSDVILDGITEEDFNAFLKKRGLDRYRGQIAPRNAFSSPWFTKIDLRFAQTLPNPVSGNRARLLFDIENFGNLLNSDWGRYETNAPLTPVVDVSVDNASGKYIYRNLRSNSRAGVDVLESVWRLQLTLMYDF